MNMVHDNGEVGLAPAKNILDLLESFGCHNLPNGGCWKPYLTFKFVVVSHQFSTTPYLYHFPKQKLRNNKIWELYNEGWGFTKIHRYMKENGYQVSKYPSSIGNIIKCRIRREKILNQPTTVDRFVNLRMEMMRD
jgi:hypothetical protein